MHIQSSEGHCQLRHILQVQCGCRYFRQFLDSFTFIINYQTSGESYFFRHPANHIFLCLGSLGLLYCILETFFCWGQYPPNSSFLLRLLELLHISRSVSLLQRLQFFLLALLGLAMAIRDQTKSVSSPLSFSTHILSVRVVCGIFALILNDEIWFEILFLIFPPVSPMYSHLFTVPPLGFLSHL